MQIHLSENFTYNKLLRFDSIDLFGWKNLNMLNEFIKHLRCKFLY